MTYWMYDVSNKRKGDSGGMSDAIFVDEKQGCSVVHDARPTLGAYMKVGSSYARTMQSQDWWRTNKVAEILVDTHDYVKFVTASGSVYEWKHT